MTPAPSPVVHLELHTGDLERARLFVSRLLRWRSEQIDTPAGTYAALEIGGALGAGIVDCGLRPALWLPYVAVAQIHASTAYAVKIGARVLLGPCEGPAGWRSVISTAEAGQIALWQQRERC